MTSTNTRTPRERAEFLTDGCDHVETIAELTKRLEQGRPLRVYLGLDPTSPDLHIGHAVVLPGAATLPRGRAAWLMCLTMASGVRT